jgi:hypothetical protein
MFVDYAGQTVDVIDPGSGEHPIGVIKRVFGFGRVRYRGLKKNAHRLIVTCAWPICSWRADTCCADSRRSVFRATPAPAQMRQYRLWRRRYFSSVAT